MHRPASRDFDTWIRPAMHEEAELVPVAQRVRRQLDAENFDGAREELPELNAILGRAKLTPGAERSAERAVRELDEGTGSDAYWRQRTWKRVVVILAGPLANVIVAFAIFFGVFVAGAPTGNPSTTVGAVETNTPAAAAGLHVDDKVVAVNGVAASTFAQVSHRIRASHGGPITLVVVRDGRRVTLGPRRTVLQGGHYIWGFVPTAKLVSYGPVTATRKSGSELWLITTGTGRAIGGLFHSKERKQLTGTVGIVRESAAALKVGFSYYLELLGLVSMSLALMNLLPLLPLDGGHIAVSLLEAVRRRAFARELYERISFIGIAVIAFIAFVALNNDLTR
jgi:regulator of sigma E protease